jgi:phosphoglycerate kinase
MDRKTIRDIPVKGKNVLVRVDFNVPLDERGDIINDTQIRLHFPTIEYLVEQGAKVILLTHLGKTEFIIKEDLRLDRLRDHLEQTLHKKVIKTDEVIGPNVKKMVDEMKQGEIMLLENIRFYEEEKDNDRTFAKELASLGDIFVNDSFGTSHRRHASTIGIAQFLPAVAGFLLEQELLVLEKLFKTPQKPLTLILGGNKCDVKLNVIKNFLDIADNFLIGGGLANTFLYAQGFEVGMSYYEKDMMEDVQRMMLTIESKDEKVFVPEDVKVADRMGDDVPVADIPVEDVEFGMKIFDIGEKTIDHYVRIVQQSETIIWNGPLGAFEHTVFGKGTQKIAQALANHTKTTIVGGGETLEALIKYKIPFSSFTHVSTGGGAMLEFLQGHKLPAVEVLQKKK